MHKPAGDAHDNRESRLQQIKIKEIHKPSSFEGAVWAMQGITDAAVVYHSPPGCYLMQHMYTLCSEWTPDLYATQLTYGDVIQGTVPRLEKMLEKVAAQKPPAIIIITSPVVEIIGDDVESVAAAVACDRVVIVRPSLGGTLAEGKEQAFTALLNLMQPAAATIERSINLIGPTLNTFNWRADVFELKRMLSAIGVQVNATLTAECTVEELVNAPRAALNVCVYPYDCGIPTAQKMQERFGIPWIAHRVPIGFRQSAAWIEDIASFFGIDARPYLSREMKSARDFIGSLLVFNTFFEASAALSTDNCDSYSVGISSFLKRELGMDICMAAVSSDAAAQKVAEVCPDTLLNPTIEDKKSMLLEKSPTIVLGNYYDLKLTTDLGFKNFLYADIPLMGYIFSENCPFMGFMGAKNLTQSIGNEIFTKIFIESKGEMDGPISAGEVAWDTDAERALGRIAEAIPHFARSIAIKKMHQVADEIAQQKKSPVTLEILQEVAMKYTPTRFKAKNATIFADMHQATGPEKINFTMPWDSQARDMLEMVPEAFVAKAVSETEQYAREKNSSRVTPEIVEEYRKKLGF